MKIEENLTLAWREYFVSADFQSQGIRIISVRRC